MATNQQKIKDNNAFWDVEKAGKRLLWRFQKDDNGNYKTIKINDADAMALKSVLAWVNRQTENNVDNNHLFAKLYIYQLTMEIRRLETTVLNPFPEQSISKLLNTPLHLFCKSFYTDLHHNQLNRLVKYNDFNAMIDKEISEIRSGKILVPFYRNGIKRLDNLTRDLREMTALEIDEAVKEKEKQKISKEKQDEVINDFHQMKKTFTLDYVTNKLFGSVSEAVNRFS